jgi:uncharacterized protein (DUF983 family)
MPGVSEHQIEHPARDTRVALRRGWARSCPSCGAGQMMQGYLTVRDTCPQCGEALHHQRADDGPAYLTILIVGHLMAPLLLWVYSSFQPEPAVLIAIFSTFVVATSLYLLPRIKGAMVGLQWAKEMHGFSRHMPNPQAEALATGHDAR